MTQSEWFSVNEALPKPYQTVAAIARDGWKWSYCIGWLNGDEWAITEEALKDWTVTHWMELPEPPEVTKND